MNSLNSFFSSSIGRKWVVAVTGVVLVAFVIGHMIGNLQIFLGPEPINRYGAFLHGVGEILWIVRIGLFLAIVLHIVFTIKLRLDNRAARPVRYAVTRRRASTIAGRWMTLSGLMVLCFLVFHLLHFTTQSIQTSFSELHDAAGRHDVYRMMVQGFQQPLASGFYLVGVGLLAMHLNHGVQSLFQTLGLSTAKTSSLWYKGGQTLSWLVFLGYASIPLAVLAGLVK